MAFEVEIGDGSETANSYASVAEFQAYWDDRGFDYSPFAPDAKIEQALVKATDYIDQTNRFLFRGHPKTSEQALCFPRCYLYDFRGQLIEGVPTRVKYATIEYAKRVLEGTELYPDPETDATGQLILKKREEVGPIVEDTTYSESGVVTIKPFPAADSLLDEFIVRGSNRTIRG